MGKIFIIPRQLVTKYWWWVFLALVWVLFTWVGYSRLDPDFGWHWRMGSLILERGIIMKDQLSYTMPSYPYVDFHWLTNLLLYLGYEKFGMVGLACIFGGLVTASIYLVVPPKLREWGIFVIGLGLPVLIMRAGVRPQVETWFFLAVSWATITNEKSWKKLKWLFSIWVCLWANMHGSFFLGVIMLSIKIGIERLRTHKFVWSDVLVLVLSIFTSLINPFGLRLWHAVWTLVSDNTVRTYISEWKPFFTYFEPGMFVMVSIGFVFGRNCLKASERWMVVMCGFIFITALFSIRNAALFVIVCTPVISNVLVEFFKHTNELGGLFLSRANVFGKIMKIVLGLYSIGYLIFFMFSGSVTKWSEKNTYPVNAVKFLKEKNSRGNMFTLYYWAGYLEWKIPELRQFIDGRMPDWKYGAWLMKDSRVSNEESANAFKEYSKILDQVEFAELFNRYEVKYVLLESRSVFDKHREMLFANTQLEKDLYVELEKYGWRIVYEDELALVYEKYE